MNLSLKIGEANQAEVEVLLVFAWQESWLSQTEAVDKRLAGLLKKETARRVFKAEAGQILSLATAGQIPAEKVLLVGLGKQVEVSPLHWRKIFAKLAKKIKEEKIVSSALSLPETDSVVVQTLVEGFLLAGYEFKKYKTPEDKQSFSSNKNLSFTQNLDSRDARIKQSFSANKEDKENELTIFVKDARELVKAKEALTKGEIHAEATLFARDLVNEPASVTTPVYLASAAEKLSKNADFACKVYDEKEIGKLGMGGLLAVAQGSDQPPRFIRLDYKNGKKTVVLVGKGITFDTGGLSLKKEDSMETMKMDMAGAAAVLAIFSVIEKLRPKIHLIGLLPCTENMPSGKALKPGDIVRAYNQKTVEVINTDAEGRLILADALAFGAKLKPDLMIDLATLTGACVVALGEEVAGLFSSEEKLVGQIEEAAWQAGEKFWSMPLEKDYRELLKSEVADLKNVSGKKSAGAITAALFLQEFVEKIPWLHLDIAGPAWQEKGTDLIPRGGSGFGVRTILNFLENLF